MMKNPNNSWDHRLLGVIGHAVFADGTRISRYRKPQAVSWLKRKRTPRKKNVDALLITFKRRRTPRLKKTNINVFRLFSTSPAVVDSNKTEETIHHGFLFCAENMRTPWLETLGNIVSKAPRSVVYNVSTRSQEMAEFGCDLVHISSDDNQEVESDKGFAVENEGHFSPVQSQVSLHDASSLPYQEKSMENLDYAQVEEMGESRSEDYLLDTEEKNEIESYPHDVRSLLARGLLENFRVTYKKKKVEIHGYIRGCKYVCGCSSCNYTQALTALEFEKHAGTSSHNQNNHIYLSCGTKITLYNISLKVKHTPPLKPLEKLVEEIIQCRPNLECYQEWKASQIQRELQANIGDDIQHHQQEKHPSPQSLFQLSEGKKASFMYYSCVEGSAHCNLTPNPSSIKPVTEGPLAVDTSTNLRTLQQPNGNMTCLSQDVSMMFIDGSDHFASHVKDSTMQEIDDATEEIDAMECSPTRPAPEVKFNSNLPIAAKINSSTLGMENSNNAASLVPIKLISAGLALQSSTDLEPKFHILPATERTNRVSLGHSVEPSSLEPAIDNGNSRTPSACSNLTSEIPDFEDLPQILTDVALAGRSEKICAFDSQSQLDKNPSEQLPQKPVSPDLCHSTKSDNKNLHPAVFPKGIAKKRDGDLHQLVFKENGLPNGSKLTYNNKDQEHKTGYKKGNCIVCDCCGREMRPSQFEAHAGFSQRRQPYRHIYTSTGETLHELSIRLSDANATSTSRIRLSDANATSTSSSRTFCTLCENEVALDGEYLGDGKLHCSLCKHSRGSRAALRTASADVPKGIIKSHHLVFKARASSAKNSRDTASSTRLHTKHHLLAKAKLASAKTSRSGAKSAKLSRVLIYATNDLLCCSFCKDSYFTLESLDEKTEIFCKQCEREYHIGCLKEHGMLDFKEIPQYCKWLCSADCIYIHDKLQELSKITDQLIPASVLRKANIYTSMKDFAKIIGAELQLQILSGINLKNKLLLDMTSALFQKAFNPILDRGEDLINAMVYAKDVAGRSFGGVYCPIITSKSVVASAAVLRVFGRCVAELPLIATPHRFQRKGYFRVLLTYIEGILNYLRVEYIIVSAPQDLQAMWIKLGYVPVTEDRLQSYLENYPLLIFENSVILEKRIYSPEKCVVSFPSLCDSSRQRTPLLLTAA